MGEGHLNIIVPLHVLCSFIILFVGDKSADEFQRSYIQKKKKKRTTVNKQKM